MIAEHDVRIAAAAMSDACMRVAADFGSGDVAGEEDFTGQLIGRLKSEFDHLKTSSTTWSTTDVSDDDLPLDVSVRFSGRQLNKQMEEPKFGADLVAVLNIMGPKFTISKGILAQAKIQERGQVLKKRDWDRLKTQVATMLDLTPTSFVFVYSKKDVTVLPATVVEASDRRDLHELRRYPIEFLFLDFLFCWVGDPRIAATSRDSLISLRAQVRAKHALIVDATVRPDFVRP